MWTCAALAACTLIFHGQGSTGGREDLESTGLDSPTAMLHVGTWRAWLESPGGELPFGLELSRSGLKISATIVNGEERIAVPDAHVDGGELVLDMPHYDSTIRARIAPLGTKLKGEWTKRSGEERWTKLPFRATAGEAPRFTPLAGAAAGIEGRFATKFEKSEDPAVLVLRPGIGGGVEGTFLTSTGDYRWLAGSFESGRLRLSCFDGAHAFLFDAVAKGAQAELAGEFFSGDRWRETWTAKRDASAAVPDEFERVKWKDGFDLAKLEYPDLEGKVRALGDPAFAGRARILQVLGSWCPNCHDETAYLARLHARYAERGLSIVGLAFEMTGDFDRSAAQVRRMRERHGAKYPVLIAGLSDKQKAAEAFPALDRVLAFPTAIFLHGDGRVRAIHSGFAGPATKEEYQKLTKRFEAIVEELLAEGR